MLNTELNFIFLQKFCAGLKIEEGNMVVSYDYNRSTRALITLADAYHIKIQRVGESTNYKWATIMETSVNLGNNLAAHVAQLKPKNAPDDE